jgi:pSer/pThr/pTyr-binding forkhead associated (FHA) protein
VGDFIPEIQVSVEPEKTIYSAEYAAQGKVKKVELVFVDGKRFSVGRTKGNDLNIDDNSVSKTHAALVLNQERILQVADTGSTNGTFINGQRIAYGKAFPIRDGDKVRFGTVDVLFHRLTNLPENIYNNSENLAEKDVITDVLPNSQEILQNIDDGGIDEDKFQKTEYIPNEEITAQKIVEPDKNLTARDEILKTEQQVVFDVEKKP